MSAPHFDSGSNIMYVGTEQGENKKMASENIVIYAGTRHGKAKKRLVEREAKKQNFRSVSDFVWRSIRRSMSAENLKQLEALEKLEDAR